MLVLLTVSYIVLGLFASMWIASLVAQRRAEATPWVWAVIHILLCFFLAITFTSGWMQIKPPSEWNAADPLVMVFMPIVIVTVAMQYVVKSWPGGRRVVVQASPGMTRNPAARTRAGREAMKRLEAERQTRLSARDQAGNPRPPGAVKRPAAGGAKVARPGAAPGGNKGQVRRPPLKDKPTGGEGGNS